MLRSPLLAMLVSVALYISGNSASIAATAPSSAFLAAVISAEASLPASGVAPGTASNLAGNAAASGFPGLIIAVVVGCIFIFYLAHRRKP